MVQRWWLLVLTITSAGQRSFTSFVLPVVFSQLYRPNFSAPRESAGENTNDCGSE
jgi:hypothetical protein